MGIEDIQAKKDRIMAWEKEEAGKIAERIFPKPALSVWMVLVPLVFVYYFYAMNRFRSAKERFVRETLATRKLALEAACKSVAAAESVDFHMLAARDDVPEQAQEALAEYLRVLAEHYKALLVAKGGSAAELLARAYGSATNYLLFLNQAHQAESELNRKVAVMLNDQVAGALEAVEKMAEAAREVRRVRISLIFG